MIEAYHIDQHVVNRNSGNLRIKSDGQAEVEFNGSVVALPDVPYSRWWLKTHFEQVQATPSAKEWYLKHEPKLPPIKGLQVKLWKHQELAIYRMILSNSAQFLDMGCGKTLCALALSLLLHQQGQNFFLVLSPPTVFVTWLDEITSKIDPALKPEIFIVHGQKKTKELAKLRTSNTLAPKFILTTYETLENVREILQTVPISVTFADESSKIKNWEAKRTKTYHIFINHMPAMRRYCMSGTPSTKNCLGLYSQYESLGRGCSSYPTFTAFEKRFAVSKLFAMIRLPHGKITSVDADEPDITFPKWLCSHYPPSSAQSYAELGYTFNQQPGPGRIQIMNYHKRNVKFINQDELKQITQRNAYTVYKEEVFDLPPKTYSKRVLELSEEQRKAYNDLVDTNRTVLLSTPFSFARSSPHCKLHQICNGYVTNTDGTIHFFKSQPKLKELEQLLEEIGEHSKLIVWSPFRPQIAQIVDFLQKDLDIPVLELHGGIPITKRPDIKHQFSDVNGPQVLVANPEVGGLGLNLTAAAIEVFFTNWFKPDTRKQAEDRIWRPGQTKNVHVIDLVMQATVEVKILHNVLREIDTEHSLLSMNDLKGA